MRGLLALPNLVSLARIPLAAAFLLTDQRAVRLALIAAAGATDFLDGWLARRGGRGSRLGAVLDPVTDKTFWIVAIISLAVQGPLRVGEVLIMLSRDIAVAFGALILLLRRAPMEFRARMPGKVATVVQLAALVALVAFPALKLPIVISVGIVSVVAILDYAREGVRALRASPTAH